LEFKLTLKALETVEVVPSYKFVATKIPAGKPALSKLTV
jgi:hypothetical protein